MVTFLSLLIVHLPLDVTFLQLVHQKLWLIWTMTLLGVLHICHYLHIEPIKKYWDQLSQRWYVLYHTFSLGLITKTKVQKGEQKKKMSKDSNTLLQVYENESQHSKMIFFHFESWSLNFWDKSVNNKWCSNQVFFKPLERSSSENNENGFIFSIWIFKVQVMAKRMYVNQTRKLNW